MGDSGIVDPNAVRGKFGGDYLATERTFRMGIDLRFTRPIATRFAGRTVLETCTGGGFTTIALARTAAHVYTIEVDPDTQAQARANVERAGLLEKVTFLLGDALDNQVRDRCGSVNSAFLDPDWAVTGPEHVFQFRGSNTKPPADELLDLGLSITPDVALVLPPLIDRRELVGLPTHELHEMYLNGRHEIFVLFFGELAKGHGSTELRVWD